MKYNSNNMYLQEQEASTVLNVIPSWLSTTRWLFVQRDSVI